MDKQRGWCRGGEGEGTIREGKREKRENSSSLVLPIGESPRLSFSVSHLPRSITLFHFD